MKKTTFLSVLILLLVSLSYPLFSQQNTIPQNTVWEVVNFDETTVDRYPNIPFHFGSNLVIEKETGKGFINTDQGLMITYDGGCSWKLLIDEGQPISSSVIAFHNDYYLVSNKAGKIQLIRNLDSNNRLNIPIINVIETDSINEENGNYIDYSINEAPKGVYYRDNFYFLTINGIRSLSTKKSELTKVIALYNDSLNTYYCDVFYNDRFVDIFVDNDTLYIITDKGDICYMDSVMADENLVTHMNYINISSNSLSQYLPKYNVVYVAVSEGNDLYQELPSTIIYRTIDEYEVTNGNKTFYVKYFIFNKYFHLKDINFISNDVGYVLGNNRNTYCIYATNNGGFDWQLEFETIYPINKFININNQVYAISDETLLMRNSSNGSWTIVDYIPARSDADTLRSVWCVNGNHCLAVGSDSNTVYRTRNSTNWVKEKLDIDPIRKHPFYQIYFKDSTVGAMSSGLDVVFNTTDGGNTWTLEYTTDPDIVPGLSIGISPDGNIKLMSCNEGSSTFMTTELASYPPTIPAYNCWNDLNTIGYLNYSINSLQFKDDNTVYAVGDWGGIYKYDCYFDNYYNTHRVAPPYRTQLRGRNGKLINDNLRSIKIYGDTAYAVGDRGVYCKIDLSNPNWEPNLIYFRYIAKNEYMSPDLYSIDFKITENMYAVGDNIILNSTDGGNTWNRQYIGDGSNTDELPYKLRSVFVADSFVYAVGVGDVILRGRILQPVTDSTAIQPSEKIATIIDNQVTPLFYPNPADKYVDLTDLPSNAIVNVMDILGREVFHGKIIGNRLTVENYENGIYSVVISDGNKVKTGKFMVQH